MKNDQVGDKDSGSVNCVAGYPKANILSVTLVLSLSNNANDAEEVKQESMEESVKEPFDKYGVAPALVIHADVVKFGHGHKLRLQVLPVEEGVKHDGQRSHGDVVELVNKGLVQRLSRESGVKPKEVLRNDVQDVFVERVGNQHGVASVSFAPVDEHQRFQRLEFSD